MTALAAELGPPLLADVDSLDAGVAAARRGRRRGGHDARPATRATAARRTGPISGWCGQLVAALDCPVLAEGRYSTPG